MQQTKRRTPWWIVAAVLLGVGVLVADTDVWYLFWLQPSDWKVGVYPVTSRPAGVSGQSIYLGMVQALRLTYPADKQYFTMTGSSSKLRRLLFSHKRR